MLRPTLFHNYNDHHNNNRWEELRTYWKKRQKMWWRVATSGVFGMTGRPGIRRWVCGILSNSKIKSMGFGLQMIVKW